MLRALFTSLLRLRGDRRGSIIPMIALTMVALTGTVGLSVDSGRAYLVQSRLLTALDAAGLAAGASMNTNNVQAEVEEYLAANFPEGYNEAVVTNVTATPNADGSVIALSATVQMPTTIMRMFGHQQLEFTVESEITRTNMGLELVMVLDNTGSMSQEIDDLQEAAHELVDILYGADDDADNLWIGLVPFSQSVNIGNSHTSWLTGTYNWHGIPWAGCVEARYLNNRDTTDDPPSVQGFRPYYWPDNSRNDWLTNGGSVRSGIGWGLGPNKDCQQRAVTRMTNDRDVIESAIDAMDDGGSTILVEGAIWGWRMISPRWRGLWGGSMDENDLPLDYNTPLMNKAVLFMTDGQNDLSSNSNDYSAYGTLAQQNLGTSNEATAESRLNTRFATICTNMKNNNIIVYTVGLGVPNNTTRNLLRNCASQPDFFFDSPTTDELRQAFRSIGNAVFRERHAKAGGQLGEKTVLIDHVSVHQGLDQRLMLV